ncbi:HTH-type transcriptional regulator BetI [Defluviimonas aquaemixtae]|uniref:HTH-type transcriptional regulator BetI n=1 Tax=Albidovulum aquaemixtae TaxID=1542388 RepID=A0A2R8BLJ0_9RHOB|nr:TetR family transcriptional regulator C-terminal domain-containing protein [Defluviimonas aquaemixtae]SPH24258.1 HTH-type transcriptional regulator BetI [Defluviimonas aquaemixtae]
MRHNEQGSAEKSPKAVRHPERNRQVLIAAALDSIAEHGITDTTVSRIIERAGLSRGMIHLHFGGKDNLLVAAAEAFSREYYDEMERQLAGKEGDPAALIMAVVRADLSEEILNGRSAAIWHAFRGRANAHEGIARYSDTRDRRLRGMIREAFVALAEANGITDGVTVARETTYGTLALLEGMWTDYLSHPKAFSRKDAERIIARFLAGIFPRHF